MVGESDLIIGAFEIAFHPQYHGQLINLVELFLGPCLFHNLLVLKVLGGFIYREALSDGS